MYRVDFGTGAGNQGSFETVEDAMEYADENASFTQNNICVIDSGTDELVAMRKWYGVPFDDELGLADDPICFDKFGYYDDWQDM